MKKLGIVLLFLIVIIVIKYKTFNTNLYDNPIRENARYKDYLYNEYETYITITFYKGNDKVVTIPTYINGKPVYSIDDSAFYGNTNIEKVTIPKYVKKIGHQAFIGDNELKEVILPNNIEDLGEFSFDNCFKLKKIYIKKNSKTEKELNKTKFYKYIKYK